MTQPAASPAPASAAAPYPATDGSQACAAEDPELFFPHDSATSHFQTPRALEVCAGCPFRRPCLAYALTHDVRGVWGGTTYQRRRALRAEHGITAEPMHTLVEDQQADLLALMERGGGFRPRDRPGHRPEPRRRPEAPRP